MRVRWQDRYEIWTGTAIALVLLTSSIDGRLAAGLAMVLLLVGVVLFPSMRRVGIAAALVAAGIAVWVALLRSL